MSEVIGIGTKIIEWLIARRSRHTASVERDLKELQKACTRLVEIEDPCSDEASLLHEQIKLLYETASNRFPRKLSDAQGWDLHTGLSSARIYYWLRVVGSLDDDGIAQLIAERKASRPSSLDVLVRLLENSPGEPNAAAIERIRVQCLRDIARILEVRPFFR